MCGAFGLGIHLTLVNSARSRCRATGEYPIPRCTAFTAAIYNCCEPHLIKVTEHEVYS